MVPVVVGVVVAGVVGVVPVVVGVVVAGVVTVLGGGGQDSRPMNFAPSGSCSEVNGTPWATCRFSTRPLSNWTGTEHWTAEAAGKAASPITVANGPTAVTATLSFRLVITLACFSRHVRRAPKSPPFLAGTQHATEWSRPLQRPTTAGSASVYPRRCLRAPHDTPAPRGCDRDDRGPTDRDDRGPTIAGPAPLQCAQ